MQLILAAMSIVKGIDITPQSNISCDLFHLGQMWNPGTNEIKKRTMEQ